MLLFLTIGSIMSSCRKIFHTAECILQGSVLNLGTEMELYGPLKNKDRSDQGTNIIQGKLIAVAYTLRTY